MEAVQVLSEAIGRGIELRAVGSKLLFRSAYDIPPDLLATISVNKTGLLELLRLPEAVGHTATPRADIQKLKAAEEGFTSLTVAPLNVVLCIEDPELSDHWVAYRRTNRGRQGFGDSQATAVLDLARLEEVS